jgi:hypothetical protein
VSSENLVRVGLDEELHESVRVVVRLCARVGDHGERSDLVLDTSGLELFLSLADPCNLCTFVSFEFGSEGR